MNEIYLVSLQRNHVSDDIVFLLQFVQYPSLSESLSGTYLSRLPWLSTKLSKSLLHTFYEVLLCLIPQLALWNKKSCLQASIIIYCQISVLIHLIFITFYTMQNRRILIRWCWFFVICFMISKLKDCRKIIIS